MNAATLLDSLGVNTHFAYSGTPYVDRFEDVCAKLTDLGVRHIRDGGPVQHTKASGIDYRHMDKIWARLLNQPCDILYILAAHDVYDLSLEGKLDANKQPVYPYRQDYSRTDIPLIRTKLGAKVIAWEGLNEPDLKVGAVDWAAKTVAFQQAAAKDVATDNAREWNDRAPLLTPAIGHPWDAAAYSSLGFNLWDYGTHAAAHFYAGTEPPENAKTLANLKLLRRYSADLPIWVTECGYQTGTVTGDVVSEGLQARYLLRTAFHHLDLGIARTYLYELIDAKPGGGYGLLRYDLSEKPAFTLLKGLLRGLA